MSDYSEIYLASNKHYQPNVAYTEADAATPYGEEEIRSSSSQSVDDSRKSASKKRRRGLIEKRRRDKINESLAELKRLIPSAVEKNNHQKLEKAEILQMAVDHLRLLRSSGVDQAQVDSHRLASEYLLMGFRECCTEVARYLSTVEGMDHANQLRNRILAHLQYYGSQWATVASHLKINMQMPYATPPWSTNYTPANAFSHSNIMCSTPADSSILPNSTGNCAFNSFQPVSHFVPLCTSTPEKSWSADSTSY